MANNNGETPAQQTVPQFTVREVYKAGWLKGVSYPGERRREVALFSKKYERLWVLFCIHDDIQPFLEFYTEPKAAVSHQPIWAASLAQCMHVSPSIAVQGETFEFVVTCRECSVLRFGANTREQMNEWVEVLRNRLRDIGVLEPKENFYSPLPEPAKPPPSLSTTRDPNSPLPLPPDTREDRPAQQQDVLYADTVETSLLISIDEPVEHVTVISVNEDVMEDSAFVEPTVTQAPIPSMFSTRVRIASAPSSLREAADEVENRYEAIFNSITTSSSRASRQLPELPAPTPPVTLPAATTDHSLVVRTPSHHHHPHHGHQPRNREGLRRTVSVGPEHQPHQLPRSMPPPLLIPAPPLGRGREGLVLLPRPPLFVPAPPPPPASSLHHPLSSRHSSPLFRPTPSNPNAALQPVNVNHGKTSAIRTAIRTLGQRKQTNNRMSSAFFGTRRWSRDGLFVERTSSCPVTNGNAASSWRSYHFEEKRLSQYDRFDRCPRHCLVYTRIFLYIVFMRQSSVR